MMSELMQKYHMNKSKALEIADNSINGDALRKEIQSKIYPEPMVTIRNNKTGKTIRVSSSIAKKKYGVE